MEKYDVRRVTKHEGKRISESFEKLRKNAEQTTKDVARYLAIDEEEIKKLQDFPEDSQISYDLLYRLYYMANKMFENAYMDGNINKNAQDLLFASSEELEERARLR